MRSRRVRWQAAAWHWRDVQVDGARVLRDLHELRAIGAADPARPTERPRPCPRVYVASREAPR